MMVIKVKMIERETHEIISKMMKKKKVRMKRERERLTLSVHWRECHQKRSQYLCTLDSTLARSRSR